MSGIVFQSVQILGSLVILVAFIATLLGRVRASSWRYLVANAVGSTVLTVTAVIALEWGFILLEGVWAAVSVVSIVRKTSGKAVAAQH